jgi:S1-C subfamily serine protease
MHGVLCLMAALSSQSVSVPDFPEDLQTQALQATVRVVHPASQGEGSGVVVRYEGNLVYILTSAHIVPDGTERGNDVDITFFPKGKSRETLAPIRTQLDPKSRMVEADLAVIRLTLKEPPAAVLPLCPKSAAPSAVFRAIPERDGPPARFQPLEVLTVGMGPLGTPEVMTDRILQHSLVRKPNADQGFFHWETQKEQTVGRSGGPMIDREGRVIGICSGTMNQKGYYLSIYEIHKCLADYAWGFLTRPVVSSGKALPSVKTPGDGKKN